MTEILQDQTQNQTNQQTQTPEKGVSFLKAFFLEIIFIIAGLILLFLILNYFNVIKLGEIYPQLGWLPHKTSMKQNINSNSLIPGDIKPTPTKAPAGTYIKSPINTKNPNIVGVSIQYIFKAKITGVNQIRNNTFEITTDLTKPPRLSKFTISNNVPIYFATLKGFLSTKIASLKEGQNVRIVETYSVKQKTWIINRISINVPVLPTGTTTATKSATVTN